MSWSRQISGGPTRSVAAVGLVALALLTACGYQPLYGTSPGGAASADLASVRVARIANRPGQRLRNVLIDRMNPRGQPARPRYTLNVVLSEQRVELGIQKDATSTRANLVLTASYSLRDVKSSRVVFRASTQRVASFDISTNDFSTIVAESAARRRAIVVLGNDITIRVAIFLRRRQGTRRSGGS